MKEYKKLLLSELRLAVYNKDQEMTDESLIKAVTVNQNLLSLGYTLKPSDIVLLSKSSSLDTFYESIKELMNDVKAKPMYPNFPEQVMEMEEAEFRFHQLIHYFSTYGLEFFFGVNVSKSWLPDVKDTEKTEDDETLLNAKVIELISKEDMYIVPFIKILSKRERMTLPEKEIINTACSFISDDMLKDIQIPFKENLLTIFYTVFKNENLDSKKKQELLHSLCQHTGDVLKCCDYILSKERFKLRTSQKRLLVKLLNSYPIEDFKANVILSAKKAERSLLILQYLDYMNYSRSIDHSGVVNKLRNKYLESWESQVKYLLENDKNNALDFIAKRPGSMLRMIAWLLRLGYDAQAVEDKLIKNANVLSTQTLVSILNAFGNKRQEDRDEHHAKVCSIVRNLLKAKLESIETSIQNKKVYIEQGNFNFAESVINTNNKSAEGGYIRSGLAYKIPENVNRLRFFVYWNDKVRVDVDLHAYWYIKIW